MKCNSLFFKVISDLIGEKHSIPQPDLQNNSVFIFKIVMSVIDPCGKYPIHFSGDIVIFRLSDVTKIAANSTACKPVPANSLLNLSGKRMGQYIKGSVLIKTVNSSHKRNSIRTRCQGDQTVLSKAVLQNLFHFHRKKHSGHSVSR